MRYLTTTASAALVAALMASTSASALPAVASTDLNMRAGPGPQYPIVATIAVNGSVEIHGCTTGGNWCDVTWQNDRGWAYAPYLNAAASGSANLAIAAAQAPVPTVEFELEPYWTSNYQSRPFYAERQVYATATPSAGGTVAGATTGAIAGAVVGGPVGALVGAVAGGAIGATVTPPDTVRTYVTSNPGQPVLLDGEVVIGATVPDVVALQTVPDYQYTYAFVNGQPVLVDPGTRRIVYVYR